MKTPLETIQANITAAEGKARRAPAALLLTSLFAGACIACGALASSTAMHDIAGVGLARFIGGLIFPVGLLMIIFLGGELFTGDCLMMMALLQRRIRASQLLRTLLLVYLGNLGGALLLSLLTMYGGQMNQSGGLLGAYAIRIALGKVNLPFGAALLSGIVCNILICLAVLMATAAPDAIGKIAGAFFPVMAFVVSGTEHCVANMFYIPVGILALGSEQYRTLAMEVYGYTAEQLTALCWAGFWHNELPVTLGNLLGGAIAVGALFWAIHRKQLT